jgi:hypothetical protein
VFHAELVGFLIALGAGGLDSRAFAGVEDTELDSGGIGANAHFSAEGVYFANDMAFGLAADRGVATHLGDSVEVSGEEEDVGSHAGGGESGFDSGVSGSTDEDIVGKGRVESDFLCPFWVKTHALEG